MGLVLALVVGGLIMIMTVGVDRPQDAEGEPAEPSAAIPALRPGVNSAIPARGVPAPVDRAHASDAVELKRWSREVSGFTDIPARVLEAYGLTEMWMRSEAPDCRLSWTTLAGIGRVESRHGTIGGATIGDDGQTTRAIFGPPLDGSKGVLRISDSDRGELDGDREWDRAVGPMQFIPETWLRWRARAARDGEQPDPQNIGDAALTAGRYLCGRGGDLSTRKGWWRAVLAYNQSVSYAQDVFSGAQAYAKASTAGA